MTVFQLDGPLGGSPECPCIQPNIDQLYCDENNTKNIIDYTLKEGEISIIPCFPKNYGNTCKQHDLSFFPECYNNSEESLTPPWCYLKWCFVDADKCFSSQQVYDEFSLVPGSYSSYTTCGNISKYWDSTSFVHSDQQLSFDAVFSVFEYPFHYIEEDNGTIFEGPIYSGNGTLKGVVIDYLNELVIRTEIQQISVNLPSGGSKAKSPETHYNAAVLDVSKGIFDLGVGSFWLTSERLEWTSFSVPFYISSVYLYEIDKKSNGIHFWDSLRKTFQPFSASLWIGAISIIFVVCLTTVLVSNQRGDHNELYKYLRNEDWKQADKRRRFFILSQVFAESLFESFIKCFRQSASTDIFSTLAQKIIGAGFGFFILIITASYTANLATFLSIEEYPDLIPSMEYAITNKKKICAPFALKTSLHQRYQDYNFTYVSGVPYIDAAVFNMTNGDCDAIASDETEIETHYKMSNAYNDENKFDLVSIKTSVIDVPIGFPIQMKHAQFFSRQMFKLQSDGIEFLDLVRPYKTPSADSLYPKDGPEEEDKILHVGNFMFPITSLLFCMIVASCSKLHNGRRSKMFSGFRKRRKEASKHDINTEIMAFNEIKSDNQYSNPDELSHSLNIREYKHQPELIRHRKTSEIDELLLIPNIHRSDAYM